MRSLVVLSFITLDGVMQAPGGKKTPRAVSGMVAGVLVTGTTVWPVQ